MRVEPGSWLGLRPELAAAVPSNVISQVGLPSTRPYVRRTEVGCRSPYRRQAPSTTSCAATTPGPGSAGSRNNSPDVPIGVQVERRGQHDQHGLRVVGVGVERCSVVGADATDGVELGSGPVPSTTNSPVCASMTVDQDVAAQPGGGGVARGRPDPPP